MAISGFGRGKTGVPSGTSMPAAGGSPSTSGGGALGNLTAFIDQGSEFEGKLSFKDTVRIDGTFSGEISSDNTLIVGESGQIMATINSVRVVISGLVEGDIHAEEQIVLHKTAVVNGNLNAPAISMEEGAQLNGAVRMGRSAGSGQAGPPNGQTGGSAKAPATSNGKTGSGQKGSAS